MKTELTHSQANNLNGKKTQDGFAEVFQDVLPGKKLFL